MRGECTHGAVYAFCATVRRTARYSALDIGYVPINPMKADMGGPAGREVIGVIDTEGDRAEWTFPAAPDAVRTARQAVRARLRGWELDSLADLAALLVSELVTNALRHATGPIGVRLVRPSGLDGVLLVEVSDPLPDPPRERAARPEDESGRGLQLVASSSRRWGTRPGGEGKTVWFELAVPE
ncbi:hypothetical protein SUDANB108_04645 [Streptomyces sp. enrichment culture]